MTTWSRVEQVARESGFRADAVEKVLRLCGILVRLSGHPTTRGMWRLKGGTALNLLHLDVPRMSVDIDLNFTGAVDRDVVTGHGDHTAVALPINRGHTAAIKRYGFVQNDIFKVGPGPQAKRVAFCGPSQCFSNGPCPVGHIPIRRLRWEGR